jgi:hypothetical protein
MAVPHDITGSLRRNVATYVLVLIVVTRLLMLFTMAPTDRIGEDVTFLRIGKYVATSGQLLPLVEPVSGIMVYYGPILYWVDALLYMLAPQGWILLAKAFNLLLFFGSLFILSKIAGMFKLADTEKAVAYGLFGLLTSSVAISLTNMQEGLLLFGTMAAAWCVLRKPDRLSYAGLFLASGLVMLTRFQGIISVIGLALMVCFLRAERKQKLKLLAVMVSGILVLSGWWYLWNLDVHGTPLYHPDSRISTFSLEYALTTPVDVHIARVMDAYYQEWGIPLGRGALESSIFSLPAWVVDIVRLTMGIFLLPLYVLFVLAAWRQKNELLILLPLPVLFLVHGLLHAPIIASNTAARYMLPGIPLFALVTAKALSSFKGRQRKAVLAYMAVAIAVLASLALYSQFYHAQHENAFLADFGQLLKQYPDKALVMLERDDLIRGMVDLHFNVTAIKVQEIACGNVSTLGMLSYCVQGQNILVWSDGFYLFKKF